MPNTVISSEMLAACTQDVWDALISEQMPCERVREDVASDVLSASGLLEQVAGLTAARDREHKWAQTYRGYHASALEQVKQGTRDRDEPVVKRSEMDEQEMVRRCGNIVNMAISRALSPKTHRLNLTPKRIEWCEKIAAVVIEQSGLQVRIIELEAAIREHVKWEEQTSCEHSEASCDECACEPKEGDDDLPPCCAAYERLKTLVEPKEDSNA